MFAYEPAAGVEHEPDVLERKPDEPWIWKTPLAARQVLVARYTVPQGCCPGSTPRGRGRGQSPSRARTRWTVLCDHGPPRGDWTPISVSLSAIVRDGRPTIGRS